MISIRVHNILDYIIGAALVLCPYLFGFAHTMFAHSVFQLLGVVLILYSLLTEYPISIAKIIPLSMHMTFDVVTGIFLISAPFIYNYRSELSAAQYALHWVLGLGAIALVAFTRKAARIAEKQEEETHAAQSSKKAA